jgi:hypothetical protein
MGNHDFSRIFSLLGVFDLLNKIGLNAIINARLTGNFLWVSATSALFLENL